MYKKLSGMTGTAETEAAEFEKIYNLEVVVIPTNKTLIRHEHRDIVYRTEREKFNAVLEEIKEYHLRGQPVLVGTIAIEKSERLSAQLRKSGFLPARLLELAKAAGLDGPRLEKWAEQLAEQHAAAIEWLIRAGVEASVVRKLASEGRFKSLSTGSNGDRSAFLAAVLKRAHEDYARRELPPMEDSVALQVLELVKTIDDKQLPVVDYLIDIHCRPERLLEVLEGREVGHSILNAKQHEREALIVAQAGRVGAVTVSTNMAGRGTDIPLGGNPEFMAREEFRKSPEKYREQGIDPEPPEHPAADAPAADLDAYAAAYERWRENWAAFVSRFKAVTDVEHDRVVELGGLHILGT